MVTACEQWVLQGFLTWNEMKRNWWVFKHGRSRTSVPRVVWGGGICRNEREAVLAVRCCVAGCRVWRTGDGQDASQVFSLNTRGVGLRRRGIVWVQSGAALKAQFGLGKFAMPL